MAYSNRPSKRPDPTVAPVTRDARGNIVARAPFTPSVRVEAARERAARARKRNLKGHRFHGALKFI